MLSNINLEYALGKHIGIYPLNSDKIEGASVDLTASQYAFSVNRKESVVKDGVIIIDPGDTVIVFSNESLSLDNHYAGACYNRISFSMKGILHASSPLKPNYTGRFSVTLYNASPNPVTIQVGDPVVVVMFQKLDKPATKTQGNGNGSRFDLLQSMNINVTDEGARTAIIAFDDRTKLLQTMKESEEFKKIRKRTFMNRFKYWVLLIGIVIATLIFLMLFANNLSPDVKSLLVAIGGGTIAAILGGIVLLFIEFIVSQRWLK